MKMGTSFPFNLPGWAGGGRHLTVAVRECQYGEMTGWCQEDTRIGGRRAASVAVAPSLQTRRRRRLAAGPDPTGIETTAGGPAVVVEWWRFG